MTTQRCVPRVARPQGMARSSAKRRSPCNSIRNRDSDTVLYKAAKFLEVRSRQTKAHWRRRLIEIGMTRIRYRIQSVTCGAGKADPPGTAEVLLAANAHAFSVLPSHGFGNFCGDFTRLFTR